MNAIFLSIALALSWIPVTILLVSAIHHFDARKLWLWLGLPAVIVILAIYLYSLASLPTLASLIGWGVVTGIVLTIALDIVRLTGVKLKTMPMDMPMAFGLRATGLLDEVQKRMMARREKMGMKVMPYELTMFGVAAMMKPIIMEVMGEKKAKGSVMFWGYLWHFLNGITFGLSYVLLFGSGHWIIALGWGLLIWALMMTVMPGLMNGAKITLSIFFTALVAHIAMAIPIIYIPLTFISFEATRESFVPFLARLIGVL